MCFMKICSKRIVFALNWNRTKILLYFNCIDIKIFIDLVWEVGQCWHHWLVYLFIYNTFFLMKYFCNLKSIIFLSFVLIIIWRLHVGVHGNLHHTFFFNFNWFLFFDKWTCADTKSKISIFIIFNFPDMKKPFKIVVIIYLTI